MTIKQFFTFFILGLFIWHCNAEEDANFSFQSSPATTFPFDKAPTSVPSFDEGGLGEISAILPPELAFVFSTYLENPTLLVARWQIAEGYYLYRDQLQFVLKNGGVLGEPQFPAGTFKDDVKYGRVEVYEHLLEIKLPIEDIQGLKNLTLETNYQGCAEDRMCYPPLKQTTLVNLPDITQAIVVTENGVLDNKGATISSTNQAPPKESFLSQVGNLFGLEKKEENPFLKVDEAFAFSAEFPEPSYLVVKWKIAEGYYLYRDKLEFSLQSGGKLGTPQLPPSILKKDPKFGDTQIYQQPLLAITIPIQTEGTQPVTLNVKYQGCAVAGFCYPPTTKVEKLTHPSNSSLDSEQDRLANLLKNANVWYTLLVFFGLGLLLSLTPCVYPMIPILSGLIVGQGKQVTTAKAFIMSLTYVIAMAMTYAIVGVLTGLLGENLPAFFQNAWVLVSFALVFVVLSLSMFGFYELQVPSALQTKLTILSNRQQGGTLLGVAIMGILSALIVGPCVAAPLVGALIYIAQTGNWLLGGIALFVMSIGMGIPLILIGTSAGHLLPKAEKWMNSVKSVFGVLLLAVAIWMLERVIPGSVTMLLWATLLIVSAVYLGALENLPNDPDKPTSGWQKLWKGLGMILMIYGILLMIGVASGNVNPLQPLQNFRVSSHTSVTETAQAEAISFKPIKGIKGLERELAIATAQKKPVMLDFYADWCISCKEMEHFTFTDTEVQKQLAQFVLLKADITANDEQDQALYKHFGIFGPPAFLFFDTNGQEQRAERVVGFMATEPFRQHLNKVLQP